MSKCRSCGEMKWKGTPCINATCPTVTNRTQTMKVKTGHGAIAVKSHFFHALNSTAKPWSGRNSC